ncbi:MAG: inositol monophosphatase family protein [Verrucomicrobiota bacterium]|jgi:myo-inositol-1(or 4)-monophosphatase
MKTVSQKSALITAIQAARAAGQVMHANWHRPKRIKLASAHDIKLELDVRCQKLIEKILRSAFPQIPLLGEEGDSGDVNAEYRWVVDPIDGTVNYFFGLPHAAVSIALQSKSDKRQVTGDKKNGRRRTHLPATGHAPHVTLLGVIYDPFTDELWTVARGGPTRLNGRVVRVSHRARLDEAVIAMGFSKSRENLEKSLPHLIRLARRVKKLRLLGSAALELAYVASGRLDAYVERTINLWDIAAGALMVERSGGECYTRPAPGGKLRMCADNGRLRRKLQVENLLK